MKRALKTSLIEKQNGACALTQTPLNVNLSLVDTDRKIQKNSGGIYTEENTRIVDPIAHMKRHGIYRERESSLNEIKKLIDAREQLRKQVNSAGNRLLAFQRRTDELDEATKLFIEDQMSSAVKAMGKLDRRIEKEIKASPEAIVHSALNVVGVGKITVAYMMTYIDIHKARHASSLWSYCGLHKSSNERYKKGVAGGGNKTLRTVLYTMADSMMKNKNCPYRLVYDRAKAQKEQSEHMVQSRNTQGKLVEVMWKDTKPSHRHGHALRQMMKHFLADWWFAHRTLEGLETRPLYVQEKLGHTGIINPQERGWIV